MVYFNKFYKNKARKPLRYSYVFAMLCCNLISVLVAQKDTQTAEQDVTQAVIGEETLSFVNISDVTLIQKYIAASSNN